MSFLTKNTNSISSSTSHISKKTPDKVSNNVSIDNKILLSKHDVSKNVDSKFWLSFAGVISIISGFVFYSDKRKSHATDRNEHSVTTDENILMHDNAHLSATITSVTMPSGKDNLNLNVSNGGSVNATLLNISGTLNGVIPAGSKVEIYDGDSSIGIAKLSSDNLSWDFIDTRDLPHGKTIFYNARISGNDGNTQPTKDFYSIHIDLESPKTVPLITGVVDDFGLFTGVVSSGGVSDDSSLKVTGTLSSSLSVGEFVNVYDNNTLLGKAIIGPDANTWSFSDNRNLSNGEEVHYFARISDSAGNLTDASPVYRVTVDTIMPTITSTITGVNDNVGPLTGMVSPGATTDDTQLDVVGRLDAPLSSGETVRIYDGSIYLGNAIVNNDTNSWSYSDDRTLSNSKVINYSSRVADNAGNETLSTDSYNVIIDTVNPEISTTISRETDGYHLNLHGYLDSSFGYQKQLQVSTDQGLTWKNIDVDYQQTLVRKLDYSDPNWANQTFNYGLGWSGNGFGLTGTQRGAPEIMYITEFDGRKALTFGPSERDSAWYSLHPEAVNTGVYGSPDNERQDDFYMVSQNWVPGDEPAFTAHYYVDLAGGAATSLRTTSYTVSNGSRWPGIWLYEDHVTLRTPKGDITSAYTFNTLESQWVTLGMRVSEDGDLHYYMNFDYDDNIFKESNYLGSVNKDYGGGTLTGQIDASVMISNGVDRTGQVGIGDITYTKRNDNSSTWSFTDDRVFDDGSNVNYEVRVIDRLSETVDYLTSYNYTIQSVI